MIAEEKSKDTIQIEHLSAQVREQDAIMQDLKSELQNRKMESHSKIVNLESEI